MAKWSLKDKTLIQIQCPVHSRCTEVSRSSALTAEPVWFILFIYLFIYLFVVNFVIHWNETAMGFVWFIFIPGIMDLQWDNSGDFSGGSVAKTLCA